MVNFYCAILLLVSILTHTSTNLVLPESRANNAVENGTDVMENRSEVDIEDKSQLSLGADLNTNIESPDPEEFLNFIRINREDDLELLGATALPLPLQTQSSVSFFGPISDMRDSVSDLFDLDLFELDGGIGVDEGMDWAVVEEQARLDFYKGFNEITEAELMETAPLKQVEGDETPNRRRRQKSRNEDENANSAFESSASEDSGSERDSITRVCTSPEKAGRSSDACEEMNSILDDLWETDSGVFDFLESPGGTVQNSDFNYDSIESVNSTISSQSDEDSGSQQDADDSSSSVDMIQAAPIHSNARPTSHPAQPRGFQVHARMPGLLRGGSMDQRWQELASLLSLQQPPHDGSGGPLPPSFTHPFGPHHHHPLHHAPAPLHHHPMHHPPFSSAGPPTAPYNSDTVRSVLLQNASLAPDLNSNSPYGSVGMGPPPNVGSAVASSMHLTNSTDPMLDPSSHYKMIEPSHDMIYYPNTNSGEMGNQTAEGFLSSILNDDDLQLMDMAMNEGMHTLRQLDNGVSGSYAASIGAAAAIAQGPQPNLPHGGTPGSCPPGNCAPIGSAQVVTSAEDRLEASSDSAVSSMGSERVPPMTDPAAVSDGEWVDPDSHPHSSHDSSPYSLDYTSGKLRGYDYYGKERVPVPVAQKKHQMFGKRFLQEQGSHPYMLSHHPSSGLHLPYPTGSNGLPHPSSMDSLDMKYSCDVDFTRHQNDGRPPANLGPVDIVNNNHSYSLPNSHPENPLLTAPSVRPPRPAPKEKPKMNQDLGRFAEESLSRDEKRARSMNLPISTDDIINLPMDEFNERLSKYDLSEAQLTLIRDIRRRGKNKVAAQNCRKRKLDQILQLADEVQRIRDLKQSLLREREELIGRRENLKEKYTGLYRHVFQSLRDPDGNPYSLFDYTLQQAADGNIVLVPRNGTLSANGQSSSINPSNPSRRDKSKDEYKKDGAS